MPVKLITLKAPPAALAINFHRLSPEVRKGDSPDGQRGHAFATDVSSHPAPASSDFEGAPARAATAGRSQKPGWATLSVYIAMVIIPPSRTSGRMQDVRSASVACEAGEGGAH